MSLFIMTGLTPSSKIECRGRLQLACTKLGEFSPSDATTKEDRISPLAYLALRATVTALIEYQGPPSFRDLCTRNITFENFSKLTPGKIKIVEKKKGCCTEEAYSDFCKDKTPERVERLLRNAAYIYFSNDPSFTDLNSQYFSKEPIDSWLLGANYLAHHVHYPPPLRSLLCTSKDPKQVHSLLQLDCNPNITGNWGTTPLHLAIELGHTEIVSLLINRGADVNRECHNRTPLMVAALGYSKGKSIRLLIDAGADPHAKDNQGKTPLHFAAWGHSKGKSIQPLITAGADPHAKDNQGRTPLHSAAWGHSKGESIRLLIAAEADPHAKDNQGKTPLHLAALGYSKGKSIQPLIDAGADPDAKDNQGRTLLHLAAELGIAEITSPLIAAEADPDAKDNQGRTPLHLAAESGRTEIATLLIAAGADLLAKDNLGKTPLMLAIESFAGPHQGNSFYGPTSIPSIAAENLKKELIELLTQAESEIKCQRRLQLAFKKLDDFSPSDATTEKDRISPLAYLALRATVTALIEYQGPSSFRDLCTRNITFKNFSELTQDEITKIKTEKGDCTQETYSEFCKDKIPEKVERLLRNAAYIYFSKDPSFTNLNSQYFSKKPIDSWVLGADYPPPVSSLLFKNDPKQVHSLLQLDCNPNIKNVSGITPLHLAAKSGCTKTPSLLINKGAHVNKRNNQGRTPLHFAAWWNSEGESIQLLIDAGADLHAKDNQGRTPLHLAFSRKSAEKLTQPLIAAGADLRAKDNRGKTPLDMLAIKSSTGPHQRDNQGRTPFMLARETPDPAFPPDLPLVEFLKNATLGAAVFYISWEAFACSDILNPARDPSEWSLLNHFNPFYESPQTFEECFAGYFLK